MEWDVTPPAQNLPRLVATHNSGLVIGPTAAGSASISLGNYLALNQYAGPFTSKLVREAVAYAVNKNAIVQILGGKSDRLHDLAARAAGQRGVHPGLQPVPRQ